MRMLKGTPQPQHASETDRKPESSLPPSTRSSKQAIAKVSHFVCPASAATSQSSQATENMEHGNEPAQKGLKYSLLCNAS